MHSVASDPRAEEIAIRLANTDGYGWTELARSDRDRYVRYALAVDPMFDDAGGKWYDPDTLEDELEAAAERGYQQACDKIMAEVKRLDAGGRATATELPKAIAKISRDGYDESQ